MRHQTYQEVADSEKCENLLVYEACLLTIKNFKSFLWIFSSHNMDSTQENHIQVYIEPMEHTAL